MHLMIDFETLGTTNDCVVVSLGACLFDPKSGVKEKLYLRFDIQEQLRMGRKVDGSTIEWWMTQKDEARAVFRDKNYESITKLPAFINRLIGSNSKDKMKVWCKGLDFDIGIMNHIYGSLDAQRPWKFWNVVCFRSFLYLTGIKVNSKTISHNALDDAVDQANVVVSYYKGKRKRNG